MAPVVVSGKEGRVDGEEVKISSTVVVSGSLDSVVVSGVGMVVVSVNGPVVSGANVVVKTDCYATCCWSTCRFVYND